MRGLPIVHANPGHCAKDTSSRLSSEALQISCETPIAVSSSAIFALRQAGFRFTATIDREPTPGRPACYVFIALPDRDDNGLPPLALAVPPSRK